MQTQKEPLLNADNAYALDVPAIEKERVINEVIKPFLEWCYREAFHLTKKSRAQMIKQYTAVGAGIVVGSLSVASIYPLGGDFGNVISDAIGVENPDGRKAIYGFFATNAIIPMLCLSCIEAKDLFKKLTSPSTNALIKQDRKHLRTGLICFAYVLGAFSALSPMYATIEAFKNSAFWIKALTIPASFVGPFIFKTASETRLIDRGLSNLSSKETQDILDMRQTLQHDLKNTVQIIQEMENEEIDTLFSNIFEANQRISGKTNQQVAYDNIQHFFALPRQKNHVEIAMPPSRPVSSSYGNKFFKGVGFVVGAASSYVYYTLAESATLAICDTLGIYEEETRNALKYAIASMAIIPWASMGAESTYMVFDKLYHVFGGSNPNPSSAGNRFISIFSAVEGMCASTPPTYLAIQALENSPWYAKLLIIPAFLGPASIRTVAVSRLLEESIRWLRGCYANSKHTKKETLIEAITKISAIIDKLPEEQLVRLYTDLLQTNPASFNRIVLPQENNQPRREEQSMELV